MYKKKNIISCLVELKDNYNKISNEITIHPSLDTFYHPYMC